MVAGLLYTWGDACSMSVWLCCWRKRRCPATPSRGFSKNYMHLLLGPIFLILGMFLVGLITTSMGGAVMTEGLQKKSGCHGNLGRPVAGSSLRRGLLSNLGHALLRTDHADPGLRIRCDCRHPGQRRPRSSKASLAGSTVVLPCVYGIATALPVIFVAFLLAYSAQSIGRAYNVISKVEWWARQITGWVSCWRSILLAEARFRGWLTMETAGQKPYCCCCAKPWWKINGR